MTKAFLDTSGWFAALSPRESKHGAASTTYRAWIDTGTTLITTNLVVAEMQTLLSKYRGAAEGLRFLDSLYQDATHDVVFVDRDLERAAIDRWLRHFNDQPLTLTDAVSFEVMRTNGIRMVLSVNEAFELAGFKVAP